MGTIARRQNIRDSLIIVGQLLSRSTEQDLVVFWALTARRERAREQSLQFHFHTEPENRNADEADGSVGQGEPFSHKWFSLKPKLLSRKVGNEAFFLKGQCRKFCLQPGRDGRDKAEGLAPPSSPPSLLLKG